MLEEDDDDMEGYEPVPNAFDAFIEMSCTIKDAINEARNPLSEQEKAEQLIAAMTPQSEVKMCAGRAGRALQHSTARATTRLLCCSLRL